MRPSMFTQGWLSWKSAVASCPAPSMTVSLPPGWYSAYMVTSYTYPLSTIQQSQGLLCSATTSIVSGVPGTNPGVGFLFCFSIRMNWNWLFAGFLIGFLAGGAGGGLMVTLSWPGGASVDG